MVYNSIKSGKNTGDPMAHDLKAIRYNPDGTIEYKTDFDDDYVKFPARRKEISVDFSPLNKSRLKIKI